MVRQERHSGIVLATVRLEAGHSIHALTVTQSIILPRYQRVCKPRFLPLNFVSLESQINPEELVIGFLWR